MVDELCWKQMPSGAHCTMPAGHSGDHIAESAYRGNIIDASREAVTTRASGGQGGVYKTGCMGVALALVGVSA